MVFVSLRCILFPPSTFLNLPPLSPFHLSSFTLPALEHSLAEKDRDRLSLDEKLSLEVARSQAEIAQKQQEAEQLKQQNASLSERIRKAQEDMGLEIEKTRVQTERDVNLALSGQFALEKDKLKGELVSLEERAKARDRLHETQLTQFSAEKSDLLARATTAEQDLNRTRVRLAEVEQDAVETGALRERQKKLLAEVEERLKETEKEVAEKEGELAKAKEEAAKSKSEANQFAAHVEGIETDLKKIEVEKGSIEENWQRTAEENNTQIQELQKEIHTVREDKITEVRKAQSSALEWENRSYDLQEQLSSSQLRARGLESELSSARARLVELENPAEGAQKVEELIHSQKYVLEVKNML